MTRIVLASDWEGKVSSRLTSGGVELMMSSSVTRDQWPACPVCWTFRSIGDGARNGLDGTDENRPTRGGPVAVAVAVAEGRESKNHPRLKILWRRNWACQPASQPRPAKGHTRVRARLPCRSKSAALLQNTTRHDSNVEASTGNQHRVHAL